MKDRFNFMNNTEEEPKEQAIYLLSLLAILILTRSADGSCPGIPSPEARTC